MSLLLLGGGVGFAVVPPSQGLRLQVQQMSPCRVLSVGDIQDMEGLKQAAEAAKYPQLTASALSPRDFLPEAGEDGAGAVREELPELHCVSQALLASLCLIYTILCFCCSTSGAATGLQ